jgi:transposase-like protein
MTSSYSAAFIEQALVKVYSRDGRTIQSIAQELHISHETLKYWMKRKSHSVKKLSPPDSKEKRPQDWHVEDQLLALQETHGMSVEEVHAWCRERGLFAHHLASWKAAFCMPVQEVPEASRTLRTLKDENEQLKRELRRKEKALAEAAALLVLQKKFRALWEDEVK